jgi:hypothetical protein
MGRFFAVSVAVLAATGSFLFGYDSGVMTDVIQSPNLLQYFNPTQASAIIGAINSTYSGGGIPTETKQITRADLTPNQRQSGLSKAA